MSRWTAQFSELIQYGVPTSQGRVLIKFTRIRTVNFRVLDIHSVTLRWSGFSRAVTDWVLDWLRKPHQAPGNPPAGKATLFSSGAICSLHMCVLPASFFLSFRFTLPAACSPPSSVPTSTKTKSAIKNLESNFTLKNVISFVASNLRQHPPSILKEKSAFQEDWPQPGVSGRSL